VAPAPPVETTSERRVLDAALRCVARWGLAKTTLDDVAREAGCGRATLYRLFPGGRDALVGALVETEARRFFARIAASAAEETDARSALIALVASAGQALQDHAALQFVLAHEPESILPHVGFHRMDGVLRTVSAAVGPMIGPWLRSEEPERIAEWLTRVVIAYAIPPSPAVDFSDRDSVAALMDAFVLPALSPYMPALSAQMPLAAVPAQMTQPNQPSSHP
jgi:AcrR family transcriptional regulator